MLRVVLPRRREPAAFEKERLEIRARIVVESGVTEGALETSDGPLRRRVVGAGLPRQRGLPTP